MKNLCINYRAPNKKRKAVTFLFFVVELTRFELVTF